MLLDSDDADLGSEKINKVSRYFSLKYAKAEFLLDACTYKIVGSIVAAILQ